MLRQEYGDDESSSMTWGKGIPKIVIDIYHNIKLGKILEFRYCINEFIIYIEEITLQAIKEQVEITSNKMNILYLWQCHWDELSELKTILKWANSNLPVYSRTYLEASSSIIKKGEFQWKILFLDDFVIPSRNIELL